MNKNINLIVSLATYSKRIATVPICLESLFNQSLKPRKIILNIDDSVCIETLSPDILKYTKKGLEIVPVSSELRSHNKYFYTFSEYKDCNIITVDDDVIYPPDTFYNLMESYKRFPNAVSATRVLDMTFSSRSINPYQKWIFECDKILTPSKRLFATGVGGILYPAGILPEKTLNKKELMTYSLESDDMWLKFMELLGNIPVVWTGQKPQHPTQIEGTRETGLYRVQRYKNDSYIQTLVDHFNIDLYTEVNS